MRAKVAGSARQYCRKLTDEKISLLEWNKMTPSERFTEMFSRDISLSAQTRWFNNPSNAQLVFADYWVRREGK